MGISYDHHIRKEAFRSFELNGTISHAIKYLQRIKKRFGNTPLLIEFIDGDVDLYRPATKEERRKEKRRLAKEEEDAYD